MSVIWIPAVMWSRNRAAKQAQSKHAAKILKLNICGKILTAYNMC